MNLSKLIKKEKASLNSEERSSDLSFYFYEARTVFPVQMENGEVRIMSGFRVQHRVPELASFGGMRIQESYDFERAKESALKITLKASLLDIDVTGSAGAVLIDRRELSETERISVIDSYIGSMHSCIGPNRDIFTTDFDFNLDDLKRVHKSYLLRNSSKNQTNSSLIIPEITLLERESHLIKDSTGISIALSAMEFCRREKIDFEAASVVIQGFGPAAHTAARKLKEEGMTIVGIQSNCGSFYSPYGIDVEDFFKKSSLEMIHKDYEGAKKINKETFLTIKCDIFIASLTENYVNEKEAEMLNTNAVIEGVNNGISKEGAAVLKRRKIKSIPDLIAGSGNVFYGTINRSNNTATDMSEKNLEIILASKISKMTDDAHRVSEEKKTDIKEAAEILSAEKLIRKFA